MHASKSQDHNLNKKDLGFKNENYCATVFVKHVHN